MQPSSLWTAANRPWSVGQSASVQSFLEADSWLAKLQRPMAEEKAFTWCIDGRQVDVGQPSKHTSPFQPWTPTLVLREGGASSETGHFLPMVLVKCCHASGSRLIDD